MDGMQAMGGGVGDAVPIKLPLGDTQLGAVLFLLGSRANVQKHIFVFHANIYSIVAQILCVV